MQEPVFVDNIFIFSFSFLLIFKKSSFTGPAGDKYQAEGIILTHLLLTFEKAEKVIIDMDDVTK